MEITLARGRIAGPIAVLILAGLFAAGAAYAAGAINMLGYEKRHIAFHGFGTGSSSGGGLGLKHMVFFEGQTFYARYDAEIHKGALRVGIIDALAPIGDDSRLHFERISASGSGEITYRIPQTSFYSVTFEGSVLGQSKEGGYDVSYSVTWGAR
jgi:hypothetical protein